VATTPNHLGTSKRLLEPIERISEVLFGLVMVLTHTTAITVGKDEGDAVHTMHMSALGCNLAWGIIDAVLYLMGCMAEKSRELEVVLAQQPLQGNTFDQGFLHPMPAGADGQWHGDLWTWTGSAYLPYPGFKPLEGSAGEYNGKFMCNQMVLRGGCCATSLDHLRASYRNFFYPHDRWAFTGIRLAGDL